MRGFRWVGLSAAFACWLAATGPASALTLCTVGFPCHPGDPAPEGPIPELPPPVFPQILGVQLAAGEEALRLNAPGSLLVHVPSGLLQAGHIDLRAGGEIAALEPVTLDVGSAGTVQICSLGECDAFDTTLVEFGSDPFHVGIAGPLTGSLELFANGDMFLTTAPFPTVPEPASATLLPLGLGWLARTRRTSLPAR